jgi:hypothetical protein
LGKKNWRREMNKKILAICEGIRFRLNQLHSENIVNSRLIRELELIYDAIRNIETAVREA